MLGWRLFKFAWRMLYRSFREVLQLALVPTLILFTLEQIIDWIFPGPSTFGDFDQSGNYFEGGRHFAVTLFFLLISWVATSAIAVAWHRYVLLSEKPEGWIPRMSIGFLGRYILASLKLFVVSLVFGIPIGLLFFGLFSIVPVQTIIVPATLAIIAVIFVIVLMLRLSLVLPATAVGVPMTMREAWNKTRRANWPIIVLTVLHSLVILGIQIVVNHIAEIALPVAVVCTFFVYFGNLMFWTSMLTTLYGYYIEEREL